MRMEPSIASWRKKRSRPQNKQHTEYTHRLIIIKYTTTILSSSFSQSLFCLTHATCRLLENRPNRRLRKVTNPGEKKQKNKMQLGPRKNK